MSIKSFSVRAIVLSSTTILAQPAFAEDAADRDYLPTDILVIGERESYRSDDGTSGTKTPTPLIDVPQAVSVITADQLEDQNITRLNDALRYIPGVSLESGEGHRDEVFIRGQESTADFYLDGLRDDAEYYRPLYNVERVEVLKGANALIFGRGGGGGAINRVSKKADTRMMFGSLAGAAGTFGDFSATGDINAPVNENIAVRLSATYEELNNDRDFYDGRFFGISPTITARLGPDTKLTASYTYDDDERVTDRGVPSFNGLPLMGYDKTFFGDPDYNFSDTAAHIARTRLEHDFSSAISVNASLQYADYDKFYANLVPSGAADTDMDGFADTVSLGGYQSATQRENLIGQVNLVAQFNTGGIGHTLLLGVEGAAQDTAATRDSASLSSSSVALADVITVPSFTLSPQRASDSDLSTFSFYAQEQLDLGIVQLVGGIRYDEFDLQTIDLVANLPLTRKDTRWSPRLGIVVKPQEDLSIYASFTESFLPQSGNQFTVLDLTTAALEPEKFTNYEAGVKWAVHPELFVTAAIFRLERSQSRSTDNQGLTTLDGESRVEGLEIGLVGEPVDGLSVSLGYSYLDGMITRDANGNEIGTVLQQVPHHQVTAWARYDFTERFGVGAGLNHMSDQFASNSNAVVLPSYTRVDAAVYFDVTDDFSLQANVENLFDETYYPSAHGDNNIQPAEPLSATISARYRF